MIDADEDVSNMSVTWHIPYDYKIAATTFICVDCVGTAWTKKGHLSVVCSGVVVANERNLEILWPCSLLITSAIADASSHVWPPNMAFTLCSLISSFAAF